MNLVFNNFRDIYEFRTAITSRPNNEKCGHNSRNANDDWAGMPYDNALEALTVGLPDMTEQFKTEVKRYTAKTLVDNKRRPINYYNGHSPNVPAAIIGLPKSMRKTVKTPQKTKVLTFVYSMGALGNVDADVITNAGLTAAKLVVALESYGYRVNLYACPSMAKCGNDVATCIIKLKDAKQPLDVAKIAFTLGNVAMFRRLGFAWRETVSGLKSRDWWGSYGQTIYDHGEALELLKQLRVDTKDIYYANVMDCKKVRFDAIKLAQTLGIKVD